MKHLESLVLNFILGLVLGTLAATFLVSEASSMYVTPPKIIYPKSSPGAPWDRIKLQINVTDAENPISKVILFYSTNETEPRTYTEVPMELVNGDNFTGTWICEIPPQKNGTTIYIYSSVIDSKGEDHAVTTKYPPSRFKIAVYEPRFSISFFQIEGIDEKNLLADVLVTFDIYWPNDNPYLYVWLNNQDIEIRRLEINATERFKFQKQLDITGLKLNGDATRFPLDCYSLNLNFSVGFDAKTTFSPENIRFGTYADYYIWSYSNDNKTDFDGSYSIISINTSIERREEYSRFYTFPILIFAFVLGVTYLLSSDEHIRSRLTVYLALFVFAWQYNNTIKNSVPTIVIGATFAEIMMSYLAYFTGIYIISTFLGNFWMNKTEEEAKKISYNILFDGLTIPWITYLFFFFPVLKTPFFEKTLFKCIPTEWGFLVYMGLISGWFYKFITNIVWKWVKKRFGLRNYDTFLEC